MILAPLADCPRPLLALDASGPQASVALVEQGERVAEVVLDAKVLPSDALVSNIHRLLGAAKRPASELRAIAVGLGPGSYTGLRVALASAKGLALGGGVELYGFSSLAMLAASAAHEAKLAPGELVLCVRDALRGSLYAGLYTTSAAGVLRTVLADALVVETELAAWLCAATSKRPALVTGDAAPHVAQALGAAWVKETPRALCGLVLCAEAIHKRRAADLAALVPNYLRPSLSVPPPPSKK